MSGIEVVGLVLAVFPGVVRGLQQFAQRIATSKPWKRYSELSSLSRTLETQQVVFLNTIERIFEGIIQSNDELEALVGNLEAAIPDRSQYEKALRVRLGRSYDIFCSLMQALSDSLRLAREEIGIDDKGKVRYISLFGFQRA